jgi:hypothetical protein
VGLQVYRDIFKASGYPNNIFENIQTHENKFNFFFSVIIWWNIFPVLTLIEKEFKVERQILLNSIRMIIIKESKKAKKIANALPDVKNRKILKDHIQTQLNALLYCPYVVVRDPLRDIILQSQVKGWGSFPSLIGKMPTAVVNIENPLFIES